MIEAKREADQRSNGKASTAHSLEPWLTQSAGPLGGQRVPRSPAAGER